MRSSRFEVLSRPPQGWSSLLLFLGMLAVVGLSIADARRLGLGSGADERTASLVVVMVAAGLVGFVLGRSTLGIVRSHVLGAIAGAAVLLMMIGAVVQDTASVLLYDLDAVGVRVEALGAELQAGIDRWLLTPGDVPVAATLLVLGAICWTTGQFGAFSIFRYDRGGAAVMSTGTLLFLNVATQALAPSGDLLPLVPVLAVYSGLAMLLLMRLQLVHQAEHWTRRHISDTGEVARLFLRSGTMFVVLAVVGASTLTTIAVAPPPNVDLDDISEPFQDLGSAISQFLPIFAVPVPSPEHATFGDEFTMQDTWYDGKRTAFNATVPGGLQGNYWWGAAYDRFDGREWKQTATSESTTGADAPLGLHSATGLAPSLVITATVRPGDDALAAGTVLGAAQATSVSRAVEVRTIGADGPNDEQSLAEITFKEPITNDESYEVTSFAFDYGRASSTITANQLREASTVYPPDLKDRYTDIQPGTIGPLTRAMAAGIRGRALDNPYDQALLLQNELQGFDYDVVFSGCGGGAISECLLETKVGFCQQFATTMVLVLRHLDIPARLVNGYLPGPAQNGEYTVPSAALHSWVEVYFPDYGWVRFDPTPVANADTLDQSITNFDDGPDVPDSASPLAPLPSLDPGATPEPTPDPVDIGAGIDGDFEPPSSGADLIGGALTIGGLAALATFILFAIVLFRVRRLPTADAAFAYRGIVSLASRLGYGPHPSQTEYEYAGTLSEALPSVKEDLYVVAAARVESAYGQREHGGDRLAALKHSYARIRTALLRLTLRRKR